MPSSRISAAQAEPSFAELFTPKLITVLREGYGWSDLRADAVSGLTVAVVALPLSMAIAIASGVSPERGLYTASAPFELRAQRAGCRQYRLDRVWRHLRDRHGGATPPTYARALTARFRGFFTAVTCSSSLLWPPPSSASFRSPRLALFWRSSPGTWRKRRSSGRCCVRRAAMPSCCSRLSC